jgi:hypothetical protein
MTSLHGLPLHIVSPFPPDSQLFVECVEWSAGSRQMQHRARDASNLFLICFVMLDIEPCGRTVLL